MTNYIFLFLTRDYPYVYMANNTKFSLLAKGLCSLGCTVSLINDPYHSNKGDFSLSSPDGYDVIQWSSKGGDIMIKMERILQERYVENSKNVVIIEYFNFVRLNRIISICRNQGYLIGAAFQEWHWSIETNFKGKLNAFVIERYLYGRCDFIMPISEFLVSKAKKINNKIFKLPIIAVFNPLEVVSTNENYFAYCASLAYKESIFMVINALALLKHKEIHLKLIINGSQSDIDEFSKKVKALALVKSIELYYNVSDSDLKKIYRNSLGLFIPLIPNYIPDIARFSQKIAEYLGMARPILTTNVGEIPLYFNDRENAYVMDYTVRSIAMTMDEIYENPTVANRIGENGWKLGNRMFNVYVVSRDLDNFVRSL